VSEGEESTVELGGALWRRHVLNARSPPTHPPSARAHVPWRRRSCLIEGSDDSCEARERGVRMSGSRGCHLLAASRRVQLRIFKTSEIQNRVLANTHVKTWPPLEAFLYRLLRVGQHARQDVATFGGVLVSLIARLT
jgi:hypothetical protein